MEEKKLKKKKKEEINNHYIDQSTSQELPLLEIALSETIDSFMKSNVSLTARGRSIEEAMAGMEYLLEKASLLKSKTK